jgi:hypothetical protein
MIIPFPTYGNYWKFIIQPCSKPPTRFFVEKMITVTDSPVDLMFFDELYRHKKRKLLKFAPPLQGQTFFTVW